MMVGDANCLQTAKEASGTASSAIGRSSSTTKTSRSSSSADQLLYGEIDKIVRGIRVIQSAAKEQR